MPVTGWNPTIPRKQCARRNADGATYNIERIDIHDVILRSHDDASLMTVPKSRFVEKYTPYSAAVPA